MDAGVSPAIAPASPTFNYRGQAVPYGPTALPEVAMMDTAHNLLDITGAGIAMLERRPTVPWPGQPLGHGGVGSCPKCNQRGRHRWNGLNCFEPPFYYPGGKIIPIYGKTPPSYQRDFGEVGYYTLVLWSCASCREWWYHYLFHESTRDGRSHSVVAQGQTALESAYEPTPLMQTRSTPGRVSGAVTGDSQWSPTATLVGEPSPAFPGSNRSTASKHALRTIDTSKPSMSALQPMSGTASSGPTSAPAANSTMPFPRPGVPTVQSTPTHMPSRPFAPNPQRGRATLAVDTNFAWSPYNSRSIDPAQPGLTARAPTHSPSGFSPVAPTPTHEGVSPVRRAPTRPMSPPAKKVNRDPESYNTMRHMLACDDCRRKKKRCDPSHPGPRRKWNQRKRGGSGGASTVGGGSPEWSPELEMGEAEWAAYAQAWSPTSAAVSQSPEAVAMYAPPQA